MRIDWHKHISVDPEIHHGEPCINGTRIPVSMIVGSFADGMSFDEIIDAYPQLKRESVQAALAYAADIVRQEVFCRQRGNKMPLKITVDEDLPRQAVQLLREHGYEAASVVEQGRSGWKDPQLWIAIQKDERFLVTADKGFGDIRVYPPGTHFGVLLLRPDEDGIRPLLELLQKVLDSYKLDSLVGATTVATPRV